MAKGQAGAADKQLKTTNAVASGAGNNAAGFMSSLSPFYSGEMTNPQGYGAQDMNNMLTASNQSLGGATAGITGQGALQGARTRNSAGITSALDSASRGAEQQQSENALGVQNANAMLKQQQQQAGAAGTAGLFGTETGLEGQMYGLGPGTLNARAAGGSWMQNTGLPIMQALSGGAMAGKYAAG
jgi:hypothetical protein